mmetsp:Transcript_114849/g.319879  ORF Transcript_114849/g.319879 Transcript_114849/m.319879 type:complete len:219 (-) Transcript_114849:630-1286(-)
MPLNSSAWVKMDLVRVRAEVHIDIKPCDWNFHDRVRAGLQASVHHACVVPTRGEACVVVHNVEDVARRWRRTLGEGTECLEVSLKACELEAGSLSEEAGHHQEELSISNSRIGEAVGAEKDNRVGSGRNQDALLSARQSSSCRPTPVLERHPCLRGPHEVQRPDCAVSPGAQVVPQHLVACHRVRIILFFTIQQGEAQQGRGALVDDLPNRVGTEGLE